jgi:single-stranded-DNA-specific exonuclease
MEAAVRRLFLAFERREPVVLFGDYDVDGVTSTALLAEVLQALGWTVHHYLPHRLEEGYGLSREGVEKCLERFPAKLLIAVDCGSTATEVIRFLANRGVDVIVLDHHQVCDPHPPAVALVNPQLATNGSPSFRELCSVGLAFKLAHALVKRGREAGWAAAQTFDLRPLLDLVALGTVADLVPLTGENRILVTAGLERLQNTKRPGLVALKKVAQSPEPVGVYEIGFQLGPRLNAAGRLETATEALRLIMAPNLAEAEPIAHSLDARNRERQQIERTIANEVIATLKAKFKADTDFVIVEGQLFWHVGVVGIVASRVLREFHRPTIILGGEGSDWKGSGRSIEGFDLAAALRDCSDLLVRHGGHAMAAGLSIAAENLAPFRSRLNELARRQLKPDQLQPCLRLDQEIKLSDLTLDHLSELEKLSPFGQGNPCVQLAVRNVTLRHPPQRIGKEKQHARLWITDGRSTHQAICWGAADNQLPAGTFDLAFEPQINEYNDSRSVQLKVLDWRPASSP